MNLEQAQTLALNALAFIAADENLLQGFMATTGIDQESLQLAADKPEILGGALDYLLANDVLIAQFADAHGLDPTHTAKARAALPGGDHSWQDG